MASIDNFWVVVQMFGLAIFFIVLGVTWSTFVSVDIWDESSVGVEIQNNGQRLADNFDMLVVLGYFALHLGVLAFAFFLRSHPIVYVAGIVLIAILALLAAPLSNAYEDIIADDALSATASTFSMTNFIMSNLPRFEIVFGIITLIVMLGLARSEGFV